MCGNWQLILASVSLPIPAGSESTNAVQRILSGEYKEVLKSEHKLLGCDLFQSREADEDCLQAWISHLQLCISSLKEDGKAEATLHVAIAALNIFLQANFTGPDADEIPESPFHVMRETADICQPPVPAENGSQEKVLGTSSISASDRWALGLLAADGEDVEGQCLLPQYLLLARFCLLHPFGLSRLGVDEDLRGTEHIEHQLGSSSSNLPETWSWWTLRALLIHQRIISGPSASLNLALKTLSQLVSSEVEHTECLNREQKAQLLAAAHLESALIGLEYRDPVFTQQHFQSIQAASGFSAQLTGALGKRTVHQQDAKAQLLVHCARSADPPDFVAEDPCLELKLEETEDSEAVSDILETVKLEQGYSETGTVSALSPIEQGVLLAMGEHYKHSTAKDEMQAWQVVAFANAVLSQQKTRYILQLAATLSRLRFERSRSRTRTRALMKFHQIIDLFKNDSAIPCGRTSMAFSVCFPCRAALEKEFGEQLVSNGLVGEALTVFERRELWDSLLVCYQLLDKVTEALSLAEARLKVTPNDARLLCALGDLTQQSKYYEEAWQKSGGRSARAQRSLGRMAMSRSEFAKAAEHWALALNLNSLHPEGWFALGYCYLKTDDREKALQAFTRTTQQQPEHGDAWNNLAALCLKDAKYKEAFTALKEAVKHKRESWQTWSNYTESALQTNELQAAFTGLNQVGVLTGWQKVDLDLLRRLIDEVLDQANQQSGNPAPLTADVRGRKLLLDAARQTLKGMINTQSVDADVWGMIARLNDFEGYPDAARDALKKQVRATAGLGWKDDVLLFQKYARAVDQSATFALGPHGREMDVKSTARLVSALLKGAGESLQQTLAYTEFAQKWQSNEKLFPLQN